MVFKALLYLLYNSRLFLLGVLLYIFFFFFVLIFFLGGQIKVKRN